MTRSKTSYPWYPPLQVFGPFKMIAYLPVLSNTCSACDWIIPGTIDLNRA